ncbi:MAG: YraN family protein [Desulfobulbales bacterium]|nr:YraN family protein [Desulfobulbales bacterium]
MTFSKKELGANGEEIAARFLRKKGYRILARNYRINLGEIDIIAEHGAVLVFIEVKTRSDAVFGSPLESVTAPKQRQLAKVALQYMSKYRCHDRPARFDVVGVAFTRPGSADLGDARIELVQNAFDLCCDNGRF